MRKGLLTVADITYDPATHTSVRPDGQPVPHVTAILGAVRVTTDFNALGDRSPRLVAAIEHAGDRGSAVHADCHAYDDDDLVWESVDPRVRPYVDAWVWVRQDKGLVPVSRERRVYHPLHGYTGSLDGIFRLDNGELVLVDIKTGDPESAVAHLQTAAYAGAWNHEHPDQPVDRRWAIWLRPGLAVPYAVVDYTAHPLGHTDWPTFLACLTVYREQPGRRAKRG